MSYPEPRFLGGAGEMSATARPAVAAPELVLPTTNVHYLATGATTGGDFGLYRWEMAGPPSGPAPHFHRSITESFYVLSGTVGLYDGSDWTDAGPGDCPQWIKDARRRGAALGSAHVVPRTPLPRRHR